MNISDELFHHLIHAAAKDPDRDHFCAEWCTSSALIGADPDRPEADLNAAHFFLWSIWDAAHLSIRNMRDLTGLSQVAFADRFFIPRRTVESWEATGKEHRECPIYLRLLLAEALGLFPIR